MKATKYKLIYEFQEKRAYNFQKIFLVNINSEETNYLYTHRQPQHPRIIFSIQKA